MKSRIMHISTFFLPVIAFLAFMAWAANSQAAVSVITPYNITTGNPYEQTDADVCKDSAGNLHLVYCDNTQVWYRKRIGTTWTNAVQVGVGTQPAVAVGPDCKAQIVYIDGYSTNTGALEWRKHAGFNASGGSMGWFGAAIASKVWSDPNNIIRACTAPDIAVDGNNKAHVVCKGTWYYGDGYQDIYYFNNTSAAFSDASTPIWSLNGWYDGSSYGSYYDGVPFVLADSAGNYYIAYNWRQYWKSMSWTDWETYLCVYRSIDTFNPTFVSPGLYKSYYPGLERNCLAVDTNGDQHLVFGSTYALISGSSWTTTGIGYGDAAISMTPGGTIPHFVATNGSTLYHMTYDGGFSTDLSLSVSAGRNPSVIAGAENAEIIFEQVPSGGTNHDVYYLKTGPVISASPASHDFGQVALGSWAQKDITVTNTGTQDLTISGFNASDGTNFGVSISGGLPVVLVPGGTKVFTSSFIPQSAGQHNCDFTITSDDPDKGTLTVPLTGLGGQIFTLTIGMSGSEYDYVEVYDGESWIPPEVDGTFSVVEGSELTITAWPYTCETFTNWTGDVTSTDNPLVIGPVDSDISLTANFNVLSSSLTTDVNDPALGSVTAGGTYDCGTVVELTATPADACSEFTGWSGDSGGTANPLFVEVVGDLSVTANFQVIQYEIGADTNDPGMGSATGGGTYDCGQTVQLEAVPAGACFYFTGWSGDASGTDNPLEFLADGNKKITANFAAYEYTLSTSVSPTDGGNVTGGELYTCGDTVEITASANEGWEFTGWSGDATGTDNPLTVTMDADKNIVANFKLMRYLEVNISGGGSVTVEPDNTATHYLDGDSVALTPVPDSGWAFSHWEGGATGSDNPLNITMDSNKSITAVFLLKRYLSVNEVGDGVITAVPDKTGSYYLDGESVELTANPGSCSQFDNWSGDATGSTNPVSVTMDGDKSVTANFSVKDVTLATSVNNPAGGTVTDGGVYSCGSEVEITATPADGYEFIGWSGDATGTDNPLAVVVDADKDITANFQMLGVRLVMTESHDGKTVTLAVTLTDSGAPLAGKKVKFYSQTAGSAIWTLRSGGDTLADGTLTRSFDLPAGDYTVRAVYTAGTETNYSNEESCSIGQVILDLPASGMVVSEMNPNVSWLDYPGATGYIIQVSSNRRFKPGYTVETTAGAGETTAALPDLPAGQRRFWRVIATLDGSCRSIPSGRRSIKYMDIGQ